ncbi:MAG TPA: DNA-formamidopyrimidine glycosylase family protein [Acidimicrobiia bacterium]|nr:DNA-formamidopyrimidine glycosylase family protein [Acidimicrobiia bacterium]
MPELPQMQALSERIGQAVGGAALAAIEPIGFSGLKTVTPPAESLVGRTLTATGRRGKYLILDFDGPRLLVHLSQAGRVDVEKPPKKTRGGKGGMARFGFDNGVALLVREHGTERKAGWWVLAAGDDGPLEKLGPEPDSDEFARLIREGSDRRRVHTLLRDQRAVAGLGRGHTDDAIWRARLSPYATLASLSADEREQLLDAIRDTLAEGLERERERTGGLSEPKLGDKFVVHGRYGTPCPRCGDTLRRVSYESYEVTYCPACQTDGKPLADRRMSRLVK